MRRDIKLGKYDIVIITYPKPLASFISTNRKDDYIQIDIFVYKIIGIYLGIYGLPDKWTYTDEP